MRFGDLKKAEAKEAAVKKRHASNEGLAMMHMDHAEPFGGAIVHLCLGRWCASGAQTWCSSGRFQLN